MTGVEIRQALQLGLFFFFRGTGQFDTFREFVFVGIRVPEGIDADNGHGPGVFQGLVIDGLFLDLAAKKPDEYEELWRTFGRILKEGHVDFPHREKFQERLAKLTGGVAVVSVGAETEADMKQKKARVEDALHATRAAVEEGILPGGGVALVRCREAVEKARSSAKGDEKIGVDIVTNALKSPLKQIADNCGVDGSVVAHEVSERATNVGYDANSGEYGDMYKAGIIDPAKVTKSALTNAVSVATLLLTTDALIANKRASDREKDRLVLPVLEDAAATLRDRRRRK